MIEKKTRAKLQDVSDFVKLLSRNRLISPREAGTIRKNFSSEEQSEIIFLLIDQIGYKLKAVHSSEREIAVYNFLIVLMRSGSDSLVSSAITHLSTIRNKEGIISALVETAMATQSAAENDKLAQELFAIAIALVSDLGVYLTQKPEDAESRHIIQMLTTYLLQASASEDIRVRLSLLHFFGNCCYGIPEISLSRIVRRFGFSVLNQLFDWLYEKKFEKIAIIYLMENIPNLIVKDIIIQEVIHDVFKHNLLKEPEKFMLFLKSLSAHLTQEFPKDDPKRKSFIQHMAVLFKVSSELNHKSIGYHLVTLICTFEDAQRNIILDKIVDSDNIRKNFRILVKRIKDSPLEVEREFRFRLGQKKRGRKPSLPQSLALTEHSQIVLIQQIPEHQKAS